MLVDIEFEAFICLIFINKVISINTIAAEKVYNIIVVV